MSTSVPRPFLSRVMSADIFAPALRALGRGLVSIFTLHRFADPDLGVVGLDPAALRDHLAYLRRHRYRLLSLTDVIRDLEEGGGGPPTVAFTVDDGYGDFARIAAPVFAEFDCPVTLFVTTGFVDGLLWLWWDRVTYLFEHTQCSSLVLNLESEARSYRWSTPGERSRVQQDVLSRLEWMDGLQREATIAWLARQLDVELPASPPPAVAPISWDEVRRTAKLGVTFGPHTVTHPILSLATDQACRWEIEESYRRVRQETDAWVPVFCYPNGTIVTLSAAPASGSTFADWSGGGCSGNGTCIVTMSNAVTVTATFGKDCTVPKITGKRATFARRAIKAHDCRVGKIKRAYSNKVKKSRVISQQLGEPVTL